MKRGRTPKNLTKELEDAVAKMHDAPPSCPIFWGAELKVGMKLFEDINKIAQQRVARSQSDEETESLRKILKTTTAYYTILKKAKECGIHTKDFVLAFDTQATHLALAPNVVPKWPPHVLWARHRYRIGDIQDTEVWIDMMSSKELLENGLHKDEILTEQDKMLAERTAKLIKSDEHSAMKTFFGPHRETSFDEPMNEFFEAMAIVLNLSVFPDLPERTAHLSEAVAVLDDNTNDNTHVGNSLSGRPQGRKIIQDAHITLQKLRKTAEFKKDLELQCQLIYDEADQAFALETPIEEL